MIVIADRDAEVRETVRGFMSPRGYRVEQAADAEAAASLLRSRAIDVLISELAMRQADGTALLALARTEAPATRRIALAASATVGDREAALDFGAVRVVTKPLSLRELADAIALAHDCADGFHGWMHRMSLIDVLQMYHHAGESLVLHVGGDIEGAIAIRGGELIHAECRGESGMPALIQLLSARRGQLETAALEIAEAPRTLLGTFDQLLLEGLRSLDEASRESAPVSTADDFDDWLAEDAQAGAEAAPAGIDRQALARWLDDHAPGAAAWLVDPLAGAIESIGPPPAPPPGPLPPPGPSAPIPAPTAPPASLAWAYELAELGDPEWKRVELVTDGIALALIRVGATVVGFSRQISGDAVLRRFQLESVRLLRWLTDQLEGHR